MCNFAAVFNGSFTYLYQEVLSSSCLQKEKYAKEKETEEKKYITNIQIKLAWGIENEIKGKEMSQKSKAEKIAGECITLVLKVLHSLEFALILFTELAICS